jgi:hypothetical protein
MLLTVRAYAKHRKELGLPGGSFMAVSRAVDGGRIVLSGGKIDSEKADRAWAENTINEESESYSSARARKEVALAEIAEMEAAKLRGELVRGDELEAFWGAMMVAFRARALVLAPTIAPLVAPSGKVAEVQAVIQAAVFEMLNELSGNGKPARPN